MHFATARLYLHSLERGLQVYVEKFNIDQLNQLNLARMLKKKKKNHQNTGSGFIRFGVKSKYVSAD